MAMIYSDLFKVRKGTIFEEKELGNISESGFRDVLQKGVVSQADLLVMKQMAMLEVFTRRILERHIDKATELSEEEKIMSYQSKLANFVDMRILNRFQLTYDSHEVLGDGKKLPYIYKLSKGAYNYVCSYFGIKASTKYISNVYSLENTVSKLSYNQAKVSLLDSEYDIKEYGTFRAHLKQYSKGQIRLKDSFIVKDDDNGYVLYIEPIRRVIQWHSVYEKRLNMLSGAMKKFVNKSGKSIHLILICEDDLHIAECNKLISVPVSDEAISIHYSTDSRSAEGELLNNLIKYTIVGKNDYTLERYDIRNWLQRTKV